VPDANQDIPEMQNNPCHLSASASTIAPRATSAACDEASRSHTGRQRGYRRSSAFGAALAVAASLHALAVAESTPKISAASLRARVTQLASDEFQGRAPGTPGEDKTIDYLVGEFKSLGLAPGNPDGTYVQAVPMIGITSKVDATFTAGGKALTFTPATEFVANSRRLTSRVAIQDSDVVFVGYGVVAPEYGWDDYKGVDVRGKTLLMLVNDPPVVDPATGKLDDKVFKGRAMTYYGRWTYKYEIASAKGAAACLIIHETGPAGYPFGVVGSRWGLEEFDLVAADRNEGRVALEGWLSRDAATRLLGAAGQDYARLKAAAAGRDFEPVTIAARADVAVQNATREITSRNVIAKLEGSDPRRRNEYVIYSAHWDHLGTDPRLPGPDRIYNGALDNATGTAMVVELAQAFVALPPAERPKRSALFLIVTGEEKGLLGARYYAEHPLYPLEKTVADLNIDGGQTLGPARDIEVVGSGNSTLDDVAAAVLKRNGRSLTPDTEPEKGFFYRSDHFEFAKQGVPAFYTHSGKDIVGKPEGYGKKRRDEYTANDYHKVSDEVKPWWDFEGTAADTRLYFEIGRQVANSDTWPAWKAGTEFKAKRDAMLKQ
jgi:Zn-dependent M28 family amino/carboxypeptidase